MGFAGEQLTSGEIATHTRIPRRTLGANVTMAEDEAAGTAPEESADAAELQRIFSSYESDVEVRACPAN